MKLKTENAVNHCKIQFDGVLIIFYLSACQRLHNAVVRLVQNRLVFPRRVSYESRLMFKTFLADGPASNETCNNELKESLQIQTLVRFHAKMRIISFHFVDISIDNTYYYFFIDIYFGSYFQIMCEFSRVLKIHCEEHVSASKIKWFSTYLLSCNCAWVCHFSPALKCREALTSLVNGREKLKLFLLGVLCQQPRHPSQYPSIKPSQDH